MVADGQTSAANASDSVIRAGGPLVRTAQGQAHVPARLLPGEGLDQIARHPEHPAGPDGEAGDEDVGGSRGWHLQETESRMIMVSGGCAPGTPTRAAFFH